MNVGGQKGVRQLHHLQRYIVYLLISYSQVTSKKKKMHIEHPISLNHMTVFHMCLSLHCGERAIQVREEYTSWKYFCEVMPRTR